VGLITRERTVSFQRNLTWGQLADSGYCLLDGGCVVVPYCVLHRAALADRVPSPNEPGKTALEPFEEAFQKSLLWLLQWVDKHLFALEPWQLWERLGACMHALRINALLTVHRSNCLAMPLSQLLRGAMLNDNVRTVGKVLLRPAAVLQVTETFGANLLCTVSETCVATQRDWVRGFESRARAGQDSVLWTPICLNGTGGVGVDIFLRCIWKREARWL
jgi:hypothetical protein